MKILLLAIVFGGLLARTLFLSTYPYGFTPDEASFGYDAYSILTTGRDQWGKQFPLVLESFGDFKPPLYAYISIPSVKLFGLTKEGVRFPNAILGTFAIFFTYLLGKELARRLKLDNQKQELVGLISSLLLAISPWHMMLSRGAFEANMTAFFMSSGIYFFLRGEIQKKYFIFGSVLLGLNLFTYHAARLVTPLVFGALVLFIYKAKSSISKLMPSLIIFSMFCLVALYTMFIGGSARAKDIGIWGGAVEEAATARLGAINNGVPFILAKGLHNKYVVSAKRFVFSYKQYISPQFLYSDGPKEATYGMIPGVGVSYWVELPLLVGFIVLLFTEKRKKMFLLLLFWLFISPIPAALTAGRGYAANRAATMLPVLQVIYAFGAVELFARLQLNSSLFKRVVPILYSAVLILSFGSFAYTYFSQSPRLVAKEMLYGNLEAALMLNKLGTDPIFLVSRRLSEPHIYIAFARKWAPKDFQKYAQGWTYKAHGVTWLDQMPEYRLGNYVFKTIEPEDEASFDYQIGRPGEFRNTIIPLEDIKLPTGESAIYIVPTGRDAYAYTN